MTQDSKLEDSEESMYHTELMAYTQTPLFWGKSGEPMKLNI